MPHKDDEVIDINNDGIDDNDGTKATTDAAKANFGKTTDSFYKAPTT